MSVLIAFDFGTRRIGIAVGDSVTRSARGLGAIPNDWKQVEAVLEEWQPQACVVGLPLSDDGGEQAISRQARDFANSLRKRCDGPVHLCDERYSTRSALQGLRAARADGSLKRRLKRGDRDGAAAQLILEQWLSEPRTAPGETA